MSGFWSSLSAILKPIHDWVIDMQEHKSRCLASYTTDNPDADGRHTGLYYHYDHDGVPLYIGASYKPTYGRWPQHMVNARWTEFKRIPLHLLESIRNYYPDDK